MAVWMLHIARSATPVAQREGNLLRTLFFATPLALALDAGLVWLGYAFIHYAHVIFSIMLNIK
jgi:hypothetical protein